MCLAATTPISAVCMHLYNTAVVRRVKKKKSGVMLLFKLANTPVLHMFQKDRV